MYNVFLVIYIFLALLCVRVLYFIHSLENLELRYLYPRNFSSCVSSLHLQTKLVFWVSQTNFTILKKRKIRNMSFFKLTSFI